MINVIVADDHPIVREGLRQILEEETDIRICAEAGSGPELLDRVSGSARRGLAVHAVVMDVSMPGRGAAETLKRVKELQPEAGVLVLSMYGPEHYAIRLIKSGASAYLTKEVAPDLLVSAVRAIAAGKHFLTPDVAELIACQLLAPTPEAEHQRLSNREYDIFCKLAAGLTVKEIADRLYISSKTVSTYRRRILTKMSIKRNADMTHYALENQLIQ